MSFSVPRTSFLEQQHIRIPTEPSEVQQLVPSHIQIASARAHASDQGACVSGHGRQPRYGLGNSRIFTSRPMRKRDKTRRAITSRRAPVVGRRTRPPQEEEEEEEVADEENLGNTPEGSPRSPANLCPSRRKAAELARDQPPHLPADRGTRKFAANVGPTPARISRRNRRKG